MENNEYIDGLGEEHYTNISIAEDTRVYIEQNIEETKLEETISSLGVWFDV
jgi:viroplasmin and RNaseH domain-containing protein